MKPSVLGFESRSNARDFVDRVRDAHRITNATPGAAARGHQAWHTAPRAMEHPRSKEVLCVAATTTCLMAHCKMAGTGSSNLWRCLNCRYITFAVAPKWQTLKPVPKSGPWSCQKHADVCDQPHKVRPAPYVLSPVRNAKSFAGPCGLAAKLPAQ